MSTEERMALLEERFNELDKKCRQLELQNNDRWVTPKELSEIMKCSLNNVYIKLRAGEIYSTKKFGSIVRIPMSQFYNMSNQDITVKPVKKELSMKEIVFGTAV